MREIHPVLHTAGLGRFMKGKRVYKSAEIVFEPMWESPYGNYSAHSTEVSVNGLGNWTLWRAFLGHLV